MDCLESLALNVPTDFASKNFILFAKFLRTLLAPRSNQTRLRLVVVLNSFRGKRIKRSKHECLLRFILPEMDCLESLALNVPTDFASKNFILFAKFLRTLLAPRSNQTRLRLVVVLNSFRGKRIKRSKHECLLRFILPEMDSNHR